MIHCNIFNRYHALETTLNLLPSIVKALDAIATEDDFKSDAGNAMALIKNCTSFQFLVSLTICQKALDITSHLCQKLQGSLTIFVSFYCVIGRISEHIVDYD